MSPQTLVRASRRGRHGLVGASVTALTAGLLTFAPTTAAQADEVAAPTLQWKISDQFANHLSTHTLADGATEDADKVVTFVDGVGTHDSGNGATTMSYQGSVTGAFIIAGTTYYSVTISDPTVVIDATGTGQVTADVSSYQGVAQGATSPAGSTDPTRVTVTTFDATSDDWTSTGSLAALTDTPDWAGVLPADSDEATALGIAAGRPVDGKSFAPEFLGALMSGIRAHFYWTTGSDAKAPATFTATAPKPSVTASVSGLTVTASGTGFTCATNDGDKGIYVGVAPSGGLPDVTSQTGAAAFAGVTPRFCGLGPNTITGDAGTWDTTITIDESKLIAGEEYSVYTWRAHTHSTTSQDTATPLGVLKQKSASLSVTTQALTTTYGKGGSLVVTVPSAGTVTVAGLGSKDAAAAGTVSFALPKTHTVGTKRYTVSFEPADSGVTAPANVTATVTVAKATAAKATVKVNRKPTSKKAGKVTVKVKGVSGATAPTGKVTLRFTKGGTVKTKTVTLSRGSRTVSVPKLKKGTWKIAVRYTGDSRYTGRAFVSAGKVKVTK